MSQFKEISEDEFADYYQPRPNHLDQHASYDFGAGYGTLFETFGPEFEFVRSQPTSHIWTLLSGDDGDFIASGLHRVNRIGYFITERAVPNDLHLEVALEALDLDQDTVLSSGGDEHADFS